MSLWITPASVREFANFTGTAGRYSDTNLSSNIYMAQGFFQRETHRLFDTSTGTKVFTTEGRAAVPIPDLRSVTSVTLQGASLTQDESFWLIADTYHSGVYTTIQLRPFGVSRGPSYLANPEWFDRNLDQDWNRYGGGSLPNDLSITASWGWEPIPYDVQHAVKAMAAWLTKRADAVLANAVMNPDGSVLDYSRLPEEMAVVIKTYKSSPQMVVV